MPVIPNASSAELVSITLAVGARQTINEALTHAAQAHDRGEIRVGQDDIGDLLGDVASATHRQAHVGQTERRRIVDAVAHHGNVAPLALNALYIRVLVLGQQLGLKLVDTCLARNALGRALRVAREHDHVLNAQRVQVGDGLADPGLERVLDTEHAHNGAVDRQIQRRQALHLGLDAAP